jgi:hypothetical protein
VRHLVKSFQEHRGTRGCHFYDDSSCNFLDWKEVLNFLKVVPDIGKDKKFSERLLEALSNYEPDTQFLAVQQGESTVSVELYTNPAIVDSRLHG